MDAIRGEVSNKIRSAIKAKLMELGAYVDDELPDYIMVMVANKRSQQQMEDDLMLFLGDSTVTFTSWLHTVLSKLQQVTVNSAELKKGSEKKRPSSEDHKKDKRKKIKKERPEKQDDATARGKSKERAEDSNETNLKTGSIKSEPVDHIVDEESVVSESQVENFAPQNSSAKVQKSKTTEEEDEEDFINLKADVEGDMWGESEETSLTVAKIMNKESKQQSAVRTSVTDSQDSQPGQRLNSVSKEAISNPMPLESVQSVESCNLPTKSAVVEPKSASRIIRISETLRQEQETLKPASKIVRDPQKAPPSPIIFSTVSSEKIDDDAEIFGRHIGQELRRMSLNQRILAKFEVQQVINKILGLDVKKNHSFKQETQVVDESQHHHSQVMKLTEISKRKRRKRKKARELTSGTIQQCSVTNTVKIGARKRDTSQCWERREELLPRRLVDVRMESISSDRPQPIIPPNISTVNERCHYLLESKLEDREDSPTPPRTVESIVTVVNSNNKKNKKSYSNRKCN